MKEEKITLRDIIFVFNAKRKVSAFTAYVLIR